MPIANLSWLPEASANTIQEIVNTYANKSAAELDAAIHALVEENRTIHERDCINLNPGTNTMNPRAEAMLAGGLGNRPSLGYPGDKYEMGLEAIEKIEVMTSALACRVFGAEYAEIRVGSGALANLYSFMAICQPGDKIIVPPASIGGHVTHHQPGAAGLYGVEIYEAPIDADRYTIDIDQLQEMARALRPKLITVGGSLNLCPHPVTEMRQIADEVGAYVLFDAAHLSGLIAGQGWQQPLADGAHIMTMSTYKSLGGPPSGLILTNDTTLAQRLDRIAFPGLTANFDAGKTAALGITLLDWLEYGTAYAQMMKDTALALAESLVEAGVPVYKTVEGFTRSHQFAVEAEPFGGGQTAAKRLRQANILTCGIGLPLEPLAHDLNGLRLGTPEIARWGMRPEHMPPIAQFMAETLFEKRPLPDIARDVAAFRAPFQTLRYVR